MTNEDSIPKMKSIAETAKIVGLAKYYIRQLVLKNKVKYVRSGSKYLLNLNSLIEYLNNGECQTEDITKDRIRKINERSEYNA